MSIRELYAAVDFGEGEAEGESRKLGDGIQARELVNAPAIALFAGPHFHPRVILRHKTEALKRLALPVEAGFLP